MSSAVTDHAQRDGWNDERPIFSGRIGESLTLPLPAILADGDPAADWPAEQAPSRISGTPAPRPTERHSELRGLTRVIVVIPAHNEAQSIAGTLRSLARQTHQPAEVVVVCDNCTDETASVSAANGARVMLTVGNRHKKAGALNQALARILPGANRDDLVLTMDADSQLSDVWIETAADLLVDHPKVGAVCGVFLGESGSGLIGQLQRNEYVRYARLVGRRNQAPVLSGTGTLFRVRALREIARERGSRIPGSPGECYSMSSITEDNEITLALKTIGYKCWSDARCDTLTEVMPTWGDLFRQRLRWQSGTVLDLRFYGLTLVTASYWLKQMFIYAAVMATIGSWLIIGLSVHHHLAFDMPWTLAIVGVALFERLVTVRRAGIRGLLLAALLVPEFCYDMFKLTFFSRALFDVIFKRDVKWNHVVKNDA
jgi:biofilm PGA synthesis N-glycosyltransferase PgaC